MTGIEVREGELLNGDTNFREANYGIPKGVTLPIFFRNSYYHIIKGEVVRNDLPLKMGDRGTVIERGSVIYEAPVSGDNNVVIEVKVV